MASKIKEIEVESFRVFKGKQTFNFLHDNDENQVSNLIVIYGPNGYGKTSFSDAIEWSLTGYIKRLKDLPEKPKSIDRYVLSNRFTKQQGSVKIITDLDDVLIAETTKLKGRKISDLDKGTINIATGIFDDITNDRDFDNAYNKLILDHSKIDDFFKNVTSENKFETFAPFWDDKNDSKIYNEINTIVSDISKTIKELKTEKKEIDKELKQFQIENKSIDSVNEILEKINKENFHEIHFEKLNDQNLQETENKILELKKILSEVSVTDIKQIKSYNVILNNHRLYLDNIENIKTLLVQEDKLNEKLNILNYFKRKNIYRGKVKNKVNDLKDKLGKVEYLIGLHKQFKSLNNQLDENSELIKENEIKYGEIIRTINKNKNEITKYSIEIKSITDEINTLNKLKDNIRLGYESYKLKIKSIDDASYRIKQCENHIKLNQKSLDDLLKRKRETDIVLSIFETKETLDVCKELLFDDSSLLNKYRDSIQSEYNTILSLMSQVNEAKKQYVDLKKNNEQITQVIELGKKIIAMNKDDHCPLCNTEFKDYESLSKNIEVNSLHLYEKPYIEQIKKLNLEISEVSNNIELNLQKSKDLVIKESSLISNNINIIRRTVFEQESIIHNLKAEILQNESDKFSIQKDIINSGTSYEKIDEKIIFTELENLELIINEHTKIYENKFKSHQLYQKNIKELEIEKLECEKYRILINQVKEELKNNSIIREYTKVLNELNLKFNNDIDITIFELKRKLTNILLLCEKYLVWNEMKLSEYRNALDNELKNESELYSQKIEISNNLETKVLSNKKLLSSFKEIDNEFEMRDINYYTQETEKLTEKSLINSKIEIYLKEFDLSYNVISNLNQIGNKLNEVNSKINTATSNKKRLESIRHEIYDSLKVIFDEELDMDFINTIYQMLDPHPSFSKIKLSLDINSKKAPDLKITVTDEDESDNVNPEFYFSAAQINILSLSVFLARALKSTEDYSLNTIFMDDPIQHFDNLNILSFIDLMRLITEELDIQVIISTHNDSFFELMKKKLDSKYFSSKFIELSSFGKLKSNTSEY